MLGPGTARPAGGPSKMRSLAHGCFTVRPCRCGCEKADQEKLRLWCSENLSHLGAIRPVLNAATPCNFPPAASSTQGALTWNVACGRCATDSARAWKQLTRSGCNRAGPGREPHPRGCRSVAVLLALDSPKGARDRENLTPGCGCGGGGWQR